MDLQTLPLLPLLSPLSLWFLLLCLSAFLGCCCLRWTQHWSLRLSQRWLCSLWPRLILFCWSLIWTRRQRNNRLIVVLNLLIIISLVVIFVGMHRVSIY